MLKKFILFLFVFFTIITYPANALYGNYDEFFDDIVEKEKINHIIPKNSFFRGIISQTVSSEYNNSGDIVKVLITSDYTLNDKIILPKNSLFFAKITNLNNAQQGRNGYFSIDIIQLVLPDGRIVSASGYIVSAKNNRIFGGEFSKRSRYKTTLHRSSPFNRKGAMQLMQNGPRIMGEETKIKMGTVVTIVLTEEINLN